MDDILIKNGRVMDAYRGIDTICDVCIKNGQIIENTDIGTPDVVIDATNCLVVPGLIDYHAHVFQKGTDAGVSPDVAMLPNGVTTVVDGGSSGSANYESFYTDTIMHSTVRVKSFIALSSDGQISMNKPDTYDVRYCDESKIKYLAEKYKDNILGIKLKQTKNNINNTGLEPIQKAVLLAEQIGCRINVHVIDPPCPTDELVKYFRPGDIFTHVYHGTGNTILDEKGHVFPEVWKAKKRGVIFDACNGKNNFDFAIAKKAMIDGFYPDIISSDITMMTLYKHPAIALPWIMSKYLALGMDLQAVIAAVTAVPAKCMEMEGEIGTLQPGACADVAVLKNTSGQFSFFDAKGACVEGKQLLVPQLTIREGTIVYKNLSSTLY